MEIAGYKIQIVKFGDFKLDGGAMFGSVPKNLWSKRITCDEQNRIPLATRCLYLEGHGKKILIDCGCGTKWSDKLRDIYAIEDEDRKSLAFQFGDITDLVLTHLHFDHAGGLSFIGSDSKLHLSFPNASIHVQEENFLNAKSPNLRERASYLEDHVKPLENADLKLIKGDAEIFPSFYVRMVNGHTKGQQIIEIKDSEKSLLFPTDLVPTSRHLPLPFTMGYDMCTETVLKEKEEFLQYALSNNSIIVFEHDPDTAAAYIQRDPKGHYAVREILSF